MLMRFLDDGRGAAAPVFALGLVPIVCMVGASVDYSRGNGVRAGMQAAIDATAMMVAKEAFTLQPDQVSPRATALFNANFARNDVQTVQVTANVTNSSSGLEVTASVTGVLPTRFMQIMGYQSLNVAARVRVVSTNDGLGCVLALDRTASGAATAQGSTTVNLNGCSLYDNSNSPSALVVGGSASLSADSVGVVGGLSADAGLTTTHGVRRGIQPVADPYADIAYPSFGGCDQNNFKSKNTMTINPGVYCGGMQINAGDVVIMNPGIYYIDGGGLTVNGGGSISGTGVTLVLTSKNKSDWATVTINGNGNVNLSPPTSGPTTGIVVFGDRNAPLGTSYKFNGGANQYFAGAIYAPTGAVTFAGGASTNTSCTQVIGDTVTFTGNSNLAIDCSQYKTRPFSSKSLRFAN